MTPQEFDRILEKYLNDTATAKERLLVEKWFDAMAKKEDAVQTDPQTERAMQQRLWKKIAPANHVKFPLPLLLKIAAGILVFIVSIFAGLKLPAELGVADSLASTEDLKTYSNDSQATKKINLEDGSYVILQPCATIKVPLKFGTQREVYLTGEAFFQVAKDANHPFIVYTHEVTTKVLGTSFNIKANEEEKEIVVAVKTGRVSVLTPVTNESKNTRQEIVLSPNQEVIYNKTDSQIQRKIVDDPRVITEQSSLRSSYVNEPVIKILAAIEESYGVDIQYDEKILSACTLTSDMSEVGLYERIDIICNAIGARYSTSGVAVVIDAKPCH
jgi:transmembrane sensor